MGESEVTRGRVNSDLDGGKIFQGEAD